MDPVSIIVTALATGAAAGLKPAAEKVVKNAYEGLESLLQRKYGQAGIDVLHTDPTSKSRQEVVKEELARTAAGNDPEVLDKAQTVLAEVEAHAPQAARMSASPSWTSRRPGARDVVSGRSALAGMVGAAGGDRRTGELE